MYWSIGKLPQVKINAYYLSIMRYVVLLYLFLIIFVFCKEKVFKFILLILISAGFSNFIGLLYPPFYVIDFLFVEPFIRRKIIGVLNIADIIIFFDEMILLIYGIIYLINIGTINNRRAELCGIDFLEI
jgi:lipoprotein signal peptidase